MRVYSCVPDRIFSDRSIRDKLHFELHKALTVFYGRFSVWDIEFFRSKGRITVYVMDDLPRSKSEHEVADAIAEVFHVPVEVRLNYQRISPEFRPENASPPSNDTEIEELSRNYHAEEPLYTFEQVILPEKTRDKIDETVAMIKAKQKVFEDWGLRNIVPHPVSALNFYGLPGTGKTMAAEAVAAMLGKKIIRASYADIESKYHGEGPKRVKAIFLAAKRENAVLFIDEADSLLSKRLTDVRNGSEQAINSMRSQLLIAIEHFEGVVIFATNLIVNYDKAFVSRLSCIEIPAPDAKGRQAVWEQHIRGRSIIIPLSDDVNTQELAEKYDTDFHGREIRKAVILACVYAVKEEHESVTQSDFLKAAESVRKDAENVRNASDHTQNTLKGLMQKKFNEHKQKPRIGTTFWKYRYHSRYAVSRKV
ncbi:MAG: ATP-binding protein [Synergistaceae bacterium]|nr:ATP-binding protein [Synergistaceae bacterium]